MATPNLTPNSGITSQETIRLIARGQSDSEREGVRFLATPNIDVNSQATYSEIADIRQAASILIYVGSPGRVIGLNGRLISRTVEEADLNFIYLNRLRAWRMPVRDRDSTPEILRLWGYNKIFRGIPVVIQSLSETWSDEYDTITASNGAHIPIILPITLSLKEAQNKDELKNFKYEDFKNGTLEKW